MKCYKLLLPMILITSYAIASDDLGSFDHLSAAASEMNKTLPMMVDKVTECFVVTPHDHELDYSFRIITLQASQIHIDIH